MPLEYAYDERLDVFTIEGVRYHGDLLRALGKDGIKPGTVFELVVREYGTVTIREYRESDYAIQRRTDGSIESMVGR